MEEEVLRCTTGEGAHEMMRRGTVLVYSLIMLGAMLTLGCSSRAASRAPAGIMPGDRVGEVVLGMTRDEVIAKWGQPEKVQPGTYTTYDYSSRKRTVSLTEGRVVRIQLSDSDLATADGIRVGTRRSAVIQRLGQPQEQKLISQLSVGGQPNVGDEYDATRYDAYHTKGIAFFYNVQVRFDGQAEQEIGADPTVATVSIEKPR